MDERTNEKEKKTHTHDYKELKCMWTFRTDPVAWMRAKQYMHVFERIKMEYLLFFIIIIFYFIFIFQALNQSNQYQDGENMNSNFRSVLQSLLLGFGLALYICNPNFFSFPLFLVNSVVYIWFIEFIFSSNIHWNHAKVAHQKSERMDRISG